MSERGMRHTVVNALKSLDAIAVENPARPGTPDVNYVEGWVELKWIRRWNANANEAPVLIHHFTPQQRVWLMRRWNKDGNVWLLLEVGREWLLFTGDVAAASVGRVTRLELEKLAFRHWRNGLVRKELVSCLSRRPIQNSC